MSGFRLLGGLASSAFWIWTMMSSTVAFTWEGDPPPWSLFPSSFTRALIGLKSLQYACGLLGPLLPQPAKARPARVAAAAAERVRRTCRSPSLEVEIPMQLGHSRHLPTKDGAI